MSQSEMDRTIKQVANNAKDIGGIANAVALVASATVGVISAANKVKDALQDRAMIPALYEKDCLLTVEEAKALLESNGFKMLPLELKVTEADIRYKDCFEFQVVSSKPRQNRKVNPGSTVIVRYVTQSVIDESKKLFEESERRKDELRIAKIETRKKQREERLAALTEVTKNTKERIKSIIQHHKEKES